MAATKLSGRALVRRAAVSTAIWLGVFLIAEAALALVFALAGWPEVPYAPLWAAFVAGVNHHRRVRARARRAK